MCIIDVLLIASCNNSIGGISSLGGHILSPLIQYQLGVVVLFLPLYSLLVLASNFWWHSYVGPLVQ